MSLPGLNRLAAADLEPLIEVAVVDRAAFAGPIADVDARTDRDRQLRLLLAAPGSEHTHAAAGRAARSHNS